MIKDLPQATLPSIASATYKQHTDDFCVTENIGFDFTGEGEHLCVYIQKTNANTAFVAKLLAQWAGIPQRDVSFCGLKDRFAVTQQWFSLRIPKKQAPEHAFEHADARILQTQWHNKKLARGAHKTNTFKIVLRDILRDDQTQHTIHTQLETIASQGIPNYFGTQRFGHNGHNIDKISAIFSGELSKKKVKRNEYSILLSSARAFIFNRILAQRVRYNTWHQALAGDVFNLNGSGSVFTSDDIDATIHARIETGDIHPTAPLWGRGQLKSTLEVAALEQSLAQENQLLRDGLENAGLKQERRPTRMMIQTLQWQWLDDTTLQLQFELGKGCYATSLLDALVENLTLANDNRQT